MRGTIAGPVFVVFILAVVMILESNFGEDYELTTVAEFAYEVLDSTGHWPSDVSELRLDRPGGSRNSFSNIVLAQPKHLSRSPTANREVIVAYQYTSKRLWPYRWVCWGDLRTEYISNGRFLLVRIGVV
jgi:hypothetical protein